MAERPTGDRPVAEAEFLKRRRARSVALALTLGALVVLFYVLTIAKLGPQLFQRPM